jgi:hypothetical protein
VSNIVQDITTVSVSLKEMVSIEKRESSGGASQAKSQKLKKLREKRKLKSITRRYFIRF